jgi:hypothetical protein
VLLGLALPVALRCCLFLLLSLQLLLHPLHPGLQHIEELRSAGQAARAEPAAATAAATAIASTVAAADVAHLPEAPAPAAGQSQEALMCIEPAGPAC